MCSFYNIANNFELVVAMELVAIATQELYEYGYFSNIVAMVTMTLWAKFLQI